MGLPLREFVAPILKTVDMKQLVNRIVGVDTFNYLYAYLMAYTYSTGDVLANEEGKTTTHLNIFFYKLIQMVEIGIKPVFVFEGERIDLKGETIQKRRERAEDAGQRAIEMMQTGNMEQYKKSKATSQRIMPYMVEDLVALIKAFGFPVVNAKTEGEAQIAYMARKKDVFCACSQDYDCLLYGAPITIRNVFSSKKKERETGLEIIVLDHFLKYHGITREQFIDIAIIAGNDFIKGVDGFGIKTAMKNIIKHGNIEKLADENDKVARCLNMERVEKVRDAFLNPDVNETYELEFNAPDVDEIEYLLVAEHQFDPNRVQRGLDRIGLSMKSTKKKTRGLF